MAREATITYEQVSAAADSLKARGEKSTSRAVREILGAGSMATVCKLMQQWQSGQARQSQLTDDSIDPSIARAISNQIAAKIQDATADAVARLADMQSEIAVLIAENERQAEQLESQAIGAQSLQDQCAAYTGRIQQIEAELERTKTDLGLERHASEHARIQLAKAELRLEAVPRIETEVERIRTELLAERAKSAEMHELAAVAKAKQDAAEVALHKAERQLEASTRESE